MGGENPFMVATAAAGAVLSTFCVLPIKSGAPKGRVAKSLKNSTDTTLSLKN